MKKDEPLTVPALRGWIGDWVYYTCLMPIPELAKRVHYAEEVHPNKELSKLIQRSLEGQRADRIAEYLATPERFFSSLVLATYGGSPDWLEVGNFESRTRTDPLDETLPELSQNSLGFLRLTGSEKIFALDGQHRLAGIRKALATNTALEGEQVSVLIVAHKTSVAGVRRTRRLFTVLNKTAKPVSKRDIISLDEDDVMAIVVRRLVEENPSFESPKIAVITNQQIPATNRTSLTTISNLYDILKLLFVHRSGDRSARSLKFNRPDDATLDDYYDYAVSYFDRLGVVFPPVKQLMASQAPGTVTAKYRHSEGGHVLFRPVGLQALTQAAIELAKSVDMEVQDTLGILKGIPTQLGEPPFRNVIWNPAKGSVDVKGRSLAKDLMLHIVGHDSKVRDLDARYRASTGEGIDSLRSLREARQPSPAS